MTADRPLPGPLAADPIRVLVVDDSAFMRRELTRLLEADRGLKVVATAANGLEAIRVCQDVSPDVITMDVNMPQLDGIEASRWIMAHCPAPIVVVSSYTPQHSAAALEALDLGVVEVVEKPCGPVTIDLATVQETLVRAVRTASRIRVVRNASQGRGSRPAVAAGTVWPQLPQPPPPTTDDHPIVVIAASTGGPVAIRTLLQELDAELPAGLIVCQHMPPRFTREFAARLDELTPFSVVEAETGMVPRPGTAFVAPGGHHLELEGREVRVVDGPPIEGSQPSADLLLRSVAASAGPRSSAVILTGMGEDGARGSLAIREHGGLVLAQDEASSVVFGMPAAAVRHGAAHQVVPLRDMPRQLTTWIRRLNAGEDP